MTHHGKLVQQKHDTNDNSPMVAAELPIESEGILQLQVTLLSLHALRRLLYIYNGFCDNVDCVQSSPLFPCWKEAFVPNQRATHIGVFGKSMHRMLK